MKTDKCVIPVVFVFFVFVALIMFCIFMVSADSAKVKALEDRLVAAETELAAVKLSESNCMSRKKEDFIKLCKVLMEGIDGGKCDKMFD